jgi:hypothetical protein
MHSKGTEWHVIVKRSATQSATGLGLLRALTPKRNTTIFTTAFTLPNWVFSSPTWLAQPCGHSPYGPPAEADARTTGLSISVRKALTQA